MALSGLVAAPIVEDAHGHAWARRMAKLLRETCRRVAELEAKALDEPALKALRRRYRTILAKAKRELPQTPKRTDGNDAARLAEDPVMKLLAGRDPIAGESLGSQPTLSRFENAVRPREMLRFSEALAGFLTFDDEKPSAE